MITISFIKLLIMSWFLIYAQTGILLEWKFTFLIVLLSLRHRKVHMQYNRGHRSILARYRSGIIPLSIETGRFQNTPREFRLSTMCNDNVIEDETHFIFYCNQYNDLQEYLYEMILPKY